MAAKTRRTIITAVKAWCDADPYRTYLGYQDRGKSKHDVVRVAFCDIEIKVLVDGTPRGGTDAAAKKCVNMLNKKVRQTPQAIIEGRGKIY